MIIIEGPDGAGKTTLVQQILQRFPHINLGERGTSNRDELFTTTRSDAYRALKDAVDRQTVTLWDRSPFYSELVYYPFTTGKCKFNPSERMFFQRMLQALRSPVILCLPPEQVVIDNVRAEGRHEMSKVKDNIRTLYHRYERLYHDEIFPDHTEVYDYTKDEVETLLFDLEDYILEKKERHGHLTSV